IKAHSEADVLEGTVKRLVDFGAYVEDTPGGEGLVHVSEISPEHVSGTRDVLKEDQPVAGKNLSPNENSEQKSLTIKETTETAPKSGSSETKVYREDTDDEGPTLGDVFGDRFKDLDI